MNCNLECPFAKYNGRNHDGTQDIICTRRNWFRNSSDDCIEGYTEKEMELLKRKYPSHPKERYRVFIEGETGDNVIVDMDEIPTDSNVVSLTLEDTCQRLNEQDQKIKELEEEIARQKYTKSIMRDNIKSYERSIKSLRKSFENFDEMRLDRIRFLEKRLKKNGLSIYVNDCYDLED